MAANQSQRAKLAYYEEDIPGRKYVLRAAPFSISIALTDLEPPRGFDLDPVSKVHQRRFSKMALSYTTFLLLSAIWPDLARFGQNRFSWPAICLLMRLFRSNQKNKAQSLIKHRTCKYLFSFIDLPDNSTRNLG